MQQNVGKADSYIRFMLGLAFLLNIYILSPGAIGTIIALAIGVSMWVSSWTHYCPLYTLLKISTVEDDGPKEPAEPVSHSH